MRKGTHQIADVDTGVQFRLDLWLYVCFVSGRGRPSGVLGGAQVGHSLLWWNVMLLRKSGTVIRGTAKRYAEQKHKELFFSFV